MKINKHNYEEYILDYFEDNLSKRENSMFSEFLMQNPKIKAEIYGFENVKLDISDDIFEDKYLLKKTSLTNQIGCNYFEELCIADIEGDITQRQKQELQKILLESPNKLSEYNDLKKTICKPDKSIVYNDKKKLKRRTIIFKKEYTYFISALAASVIIFFAVMNLLKSDSQINSLACITYKNTLINSRQVIEKENIINENVNNEQVNEQANTNENNNNLPDTSSNTNTQTNVIEQYVDEYKDIKAPVITLTSTTTEIIKPTYNTTLTFDELEKTNLLSDLKIRFNKRKNKVADIITPITVWDVAQVAVNEYNNITENNVELDGEFNKNGKLTAISFNTERFGYYTNKIGRNKE